MVLTTGENQWTDKHKLNLPTANLPIATLKQGTQKEWKSQTCGTQRLDVHVATNGSEQQTTGAKIVSTVSQVYSTNNENRVVQLAGWPLLEQYGGKAFRTTGRMQPFQATPSFQGLNEFSRFRLSLCMCLLHLRRQFISRTRCSWRLLDLRALDWPQQDLNRRQRHMEAKQHHHNNYFSHFTSLNVNM